RGVFGSGDGERLAHSVLLWPGSGLEVIESKIWTDSQPRAESQPLGRLVLHQLKHDAIEMKQALLRGEIPRMAELLNHSWEAKKRTAGGISTNTIEQLYLRAFDEGAIGGKVSGAGGGGFMMFIVPPERRIAVIRGLNELGGTASGVHLTHTGAESWSV
ncbi:MAG: hypothetical protein EXR07_06585, partial [Acetobacteraceae bacterium]|nr:hypothetical protein [Acetobacteraceae bacterium]